MTSWSSIVEKIGTFFDEMIRIMLWCTIHLHGHRNKVVPFMKFSIFEDFNNGVKFHNYNVGRLMTLEVTISRVRSVTTTSTMKTWYFRVM